MTRITKLFMLIFIFISMIACSQMPVVTFNIFTPPAPAAATATPWVGGTETAQAMAVDPNALPTLPSTVFTQEVLAKPVDFSPVLYGGKMYDSTFFLLLGGVSQNGWLTPAESVGRFCGEMTYSLHNMPTASKYFLWGETPNFSHTCQNYFIETEAELDEGGFTGVMDGWNTTKREVTEIQDNGEVYQKALFDWLKSFGVASPQPGTLRILRTDLEGDGADEVFISATHLDESQHVTNPGDYSVVLMSKLIGDEPVTISLVADVYSEDNSGMTFPQEYSLANFIDLNQDGVMEVVVDIQRWEGFGAMVVQVNGQGVLQALTAMC
jgi:hypothetical protein